jgi:DNA uptake protein ComE-like DNA-binding protein
MPSDQEQWVPKGSRPLRAEDEERADDEPAAWLPPGVAAPKREPSADEAPAEAGPPLDVTEWVPEQVSARTPPPEGGFEPAPTPPSEPAVDAPGPDDSKLDRALRAERGALEARISAAEAATREAEAARQQAAHNHRLEREELIAKLERSERACGEADARHQAKLDALAAKAEQASRSRGGDVEQLVAGLRESEQALTEAERAQSDLETAHTEAMDRHRAEVDSLRAALAGSERARGEAERAAHQAAERMIAATSGGKRDDAGRLELNTATVEGLRRLGLSVTQAARLVNHRDAAGGFRSLDDLEGVPGLPAAHRAELAERVYVDSAYAGRSPR